MTEGITFDIKRYAIHDGPGIRTTVFLSGCPLRCWWCHNPEGLDLDAHVGNRSPEGALAFKGVDRGFAGVVDVDYVMDEVERDRIFYDQSSGGATFSGGEPLMQPEFLEALLGACRRKGIHTAVDTCGYATAEVLDSIAEGVDLFLFDLKIMHDEEHRRYTGVSNSCILDNLKRLDEKGCDVVIRLSLVPGITGTPENVSSMIDFLLSTVRCRQISLLPYHKAGEVKYTRLRMESKMMGIEPPSREAMQAVVSQFEESGFRVKVGG